MPVDATWDHGADSDLSELTESENEEAPSAPPASSRAPAPAPAPEPAPLPAPRAKSTRPTTQSATETSKQRVGKGAQPLRRPPRSVTFSVSHLYDLIKQGDIDLDPEYQRGVVWTDKKQSELINSIFDNYYVPPVVFTVVRKSDGGETRTCIDGKQRLTSICQFMDGVIPYKDSTSQRKVHYMNPKGNRRKMLTPQLQNTFRNKQITCVEYDDLKPEEEREIFQRVQLGVTLSPADRLPALNGAFAGLVRDLRRRIESTPGFSVYLDWGKARGKDFQALGQSVYLIVHGKTKQADPTPQRLEKFLDKLEPPRTFDTVRKDVLTMADVYCRIAGDECLGKHMRRDLSPYEFTMSLYLIYSYGKTLSDSQLADAMGRMRRDFKTTFKGSKKTAATATAIFLHLLAYVKKTLPNLLHDLKDTKPSTGPAFDYHPEAPSRPPSAMDGRRKKATKVQKEDSDVEMDSEPVKKPLRKRKRVASPSQTDIDELASDADSEDNKMLSRRPAREVKAETSKPKPGLAASRATAQTIVKRSRSSTAKPASTAPIASTSKATPVAKETKAGVKRNASKSIKAPTPTPSARPSTDVQMQVAQPSRPLAPTRNAVEAVAPPASAPPTSSRKPLPTRVTGHQRTPSNPTSAPPPPASAPPPVASGSGIGRSPAIPPSGPRSMRQSATPSAFATPTNTPPVPHHVPQFLAGMNVDGQSTSASVPAEQNLGPSISASAPPRAVQQTRPAQRQKPKVNLWPPLGTSGSPAVSSPTTANPNSQGQSSMAQTTSSRLKAQAQEMIPLGGSSNRRGGPDRDIKRRRTGDGMADLGFGQPQTDAHANTSGPAQARRATVHSGQVQPAQQPQQIQPAVHAPGQEDVTMADFSRYTPPPMSAASTAPRGSISSAGSLFSPVSGPVTDDQLAPAIETLSIQGRG